MNRDSFVDQVKYMDIEQLKTIQATISSELKNREEGKAVKLLEKLENLLDELGGLGYAIDVSELPYDELVSMNDIAIDWDTNEKEVYMRY